MQIEVLKTFVEISRSGSFHSAAKQLHITQAAASARLRSLEEQLGVTLLERSARGTVLSEAGQRFLPYAEHLLSTWQYISETLSQEQAEAQRLRLGVQLSIWERLLVDWVVRLEAQRPSLSLSLDFDYTANMCEAVQRQLVDIAISNGVVRERNLSYELLGEEIFVLVASRACSFGAQNMPTLIDFEWGSEFRLQFEKLDINLPKKRIFLGNSRMGLRYLKSSSGMAYCPLRLVASDLAKNRLFAVQGAPNIPMPTYALYHSRPPQPKLIEWALEALRLVYHKGVG